MARTAVGRLTLYPQQDMACECGRLKTTSTCDLSYRLPVNLRHPMENKMTRMTVISSSIDLFLRFQLMINCCTDFNEIWLINAQILCE